MLNEIKRRQNARDEIARVLREKRQAAKRSGLADTFGIQGANDLIRNVARAGSAPEKPTPANLWNEARELWRWANEPIRPHGDCYYSQCGLDDVEGERKQAAGEHALGIWRLIGRPLPC